jgi:transposase
MEMTACKAVLRRKDATTGAALYMSFDLGDREWHLSFGDGRSGVSRYTVAAGDTAAVANRIVKAAARFKTNGRALVHSVYEAGYVSDLTATFGSHASSEGLTVALDDIHVM